MIVLTNRIKNFSAPTSTAPLAPIADVTPAAATGATASRTALLSRAVTSRILVLLKPHWRKLAIGLVALALGSAISLSFPYLIQKILNQDLGLTIEHNLTGITALLVILFFFQAACFYVRHYSFQAVGFKIATDLRIGLYDALLQQDIAYYDRSRLGDLISRLTADTQVLQRALTVNIGIALRYIFQVIGGLVMMVLISFQLTAFMCVLIPAFVWASITWGKRLRAVSKRMQDRLGDATVVAEEALSAISTVKLFDGEQLESSRHRSRMIDALNTGLERAHVAALFSSTMVFILHSSIAFLFCYGATLVLRSSLSIGDLTAFILYCVIVAVSFGFLASVWDEFLLGVGAADRVFDVFDSAPKVVSPINPLKAVDSLPVSISFEAVSFAYPARPDTPVLENLSFDIPPGKTVALVGPSGSGKSTIASLIPRFYDPSSGRIGFGGVELRDLDLRTLRGMISVVPQEVQVFSTSIRENIAYGRANATEQEILDAAVAANIDSFVQTLPDKYDTLIGDRGVLLSGGQRQRLAIARAILKNPAFLILDEATSALDSENEALVQQALRTLMEGRTSLVIAHRLSTIQHADLVLVLRAGKLIQSGTHESLMKEQGLYKSLVEHQLL